jgi:RecA/RadA recombinase
MTIKPIQADWLIKGVLERDSLNLLFGGPSSGKTLFALDCVLLELSNGTNTQQSKLMLFISWVKVFLV